MFFYDSHQALFRSPLGALPCGGILCLRFLCDTALKVFVRTWSGIEQITPMAFDGVKTYTAEITAPDTPMLWWYDFIIQTPEGIFRYGNAYDQLGGEGALYNDAVSSYQVTVYDPAYQTPVFMQHGIIYQIFPDRFFKGPIHTSCRHSEMQLHDRWEDTPLVSPDPRSGDNLALDFFGGNLNGISEKLPYLKKLGVTILYLNPIFEARSNHRYDTGDYQTVDSLLGTDADFKNLCEKAAGLGIKILLDGVFSHTGEDSVYFNRYGTYKTSGAYQSLQSPYTSWYTFFDHPNQYKCWWNIPSLPEVNKDDPDFRRFLFDKADGIVPQWLLKGASGWRLDVADELPMPFLKELRQTVKEQNPQAVVLGEVWEDASNKVSYGQMRSYCLGDTLDSVMNYPLREALISFLTGNTPAGTLVRLLRHQQEVYPAPFYYALMNLLGSHDRARIINVLSGCEFNHLSREERANLHLTKDQYELGVERFKKGLQILCALPGAPTLYYGDEAGMEGTADPFCRGTYPWGREDKDLQKFVQDQFFRRNHTPVLQTGFMDISAPDDDTIRILRYIDHGVDALNQPAKNGRALLVLKR